MKNIFAICEIGFIFHKMELEMSLNFFYFQLPYFVYPIILWSIHNYFAFVIFNFLTMNEDKRSIPFSFKDMIECLTISGIVSRMSASTHDFLDICGVTIRISTYPRQNERAILSWISTRLQLGLFYPKVKASSANRLLLLLRC